MKLIIAEHFLKINREVQFAKVQIRRGNIIDKEWEIA